MREFTIGLVSAVLGLVIGIASCPRQTGMPIDTLANYVSGFYILPDGTQKIKHCYMSSTAYGPMQGILYDRRSHSGNIIGYEHYINEYLWKVMPKNEQDEWHPCSFNVKSGLLVPIDLRSSYEEIFLERLCRSYVKTIIFSPGERSLQSTPVYVRPPLSENEIKHDLVAERDRDLNVNTRDIAKSRYYKFRWSK